MYAYVLWVTRKVDTWRQLCIILNAKWTSNAYAITIAIYAKLFKMDVILHVNKSFVDINKYVLVNNVFYTEY